MDSRLNVIVVGAGLGGLTAAAGLIRHGINVTVLEQAPVLGEIGAGVQMAPNATKVLRALGLESEAMKVAFEPDSHVIRSWKTGDILAKTPYKGVLAERYGAGYFGFHRADLHNILKSAVPDACIKLGAKCTAVEVGDGNLCIVKLADGTTVSGDVVVGADGIHSVVRDSLYGAESPRFTGNVCWRGMVKTDALSSGAIPPDMTVWFGPGASVVHYYISGGKVINWVAAYEDNDWRTESWRAEGSREEMMSRFVDWNPLVRALLGKSEQYFKWALFDRNPMESWTRGPVTLLGDAAHPMLPYLAQGACMAMEDGYVLADTLAKSQDDVISALQRYEKTRRERTANVQLLARQRAKENHLKSEEDIRNRDMRYAELRARGQAGHVYGIDWIFGHDVTAA